ncbi:hypothetical protein Ssi03_50550 [Sphaerisporangium siamense]|uniref:Uncharacterized protein n=1 Tax=Sphaerisporangium siamense TaxID=795645 RepID=A0A7W7D8Y4_9ACTN|nr:hypothetical protein [Sphaerisporangium siamense]MBB4702241.1 hypothetical protein [Sphaerisporangium siamense]GII87065.1 hypothetical protein Ssi03_50550 [Sphaerisporangium siamense]
MAIDYSTPAGQVRLLIPDTDEQNLLLNDPQIEAFLSLNSGNVRLAAAQALDVIAASEALISKKLTIDGRSTDGPAVAASLKAAATELRRQVDAGEGDDTAGGFDIVNFDPQAGLRGWGAGFL